MPQWQELQCNAYTYTSVYYHYHSPKFSFNIIHHHITKSYQNLLFNSSYKHNYFYGHTRLHTSLVTYVSFVILHTYLVYTEFWWSSWSSSFSTIALLYFVSRKAIAIQHHLSGLALSLMVCSMMTVLASDD